MIDLKLIYNTNYESVTRAVSGRGAGGFIGAIIGAFLVDKYEARLELFTAIASTTAGACVVMVTKAPTVDYVWMLFCAIGCCSNIINMGMSLYYLKCLK